MLKFVKKPTTIAILVLNNSSSANLWIVWFTIMSIWIHYLINRDVINNVKALRDFRVTTSALVSNKNMETVKTNILLEATDDIIFENSNTKEYIQ